MGRIQLVIIVGAGKRPPTSLGMETSRPSLLQQKLLAGGGLRADVALRSICISQVLPCQNSKLIAHFMGKAINTYSPLNLTTNSADDQAFGSVPPSTHVLPLPSDLFISFHLLSHEPSSQTLIFSLVNTVFICLLRIFFMLGLEGLLRPPSGFCHLQGTLNSRHQCTCSFRGPLAGPWE